MLTNFSACADCSGVGRHWSVRPRWVRTARRADLESLEGSLGLLEVQREGLALRLPVVQGGLGVLQLPLGLVQPPAQLLYRVILAAQLSLHTVLAVTGCDVVLLVVLRQCRCQAPSMSNTPVQLALTSTA